MLKLRFKIKDGAFSTKNQECQTFTRCRITNCQSLKYISMSQTFFGNGNNGDEMQIITIENCVLLCAMHIFAILNTQYLIKLYVVLNT